MLPLGHAIAQVVSRRFFTAERCPGFAPTLVHVVLVTVVSCNLQHTFMVAREFQDTTSIIFL